MTARLLHGLAPIVGPDARVLILGNMPSALSLAARQYYAQPQNAFWRVIEDLCGVPRTLPYTQRVAALLERGIGMWDVCASACCPNPRAPLPALCEAADGPRWV